MFRLKSKEKKTTRRWIALSLIMSCETVMASQKNNNQRRVDQKFRNHHKRMSEKRMLPEIVNFKREVNGH